ncbi:MAG: hypothetical protein H8D82_01905 [Euryarchaeota archaeon]|nr:hypothetical protein [Euryarchaeota archaeon]
MEEQGWAPDEESVLASKLAKLEADTIGDESLERLKEMSETTSISEEMARAKRAAKGDRRLDASIAEQAHANQVADVFTWVLVGLAGVITVGGIAAWYFFGSSLL